MMWSQDVAEEGHLVIRGVLCAQEPAWAESGNPACRPLPRERSWGLQRHLLGGDRVC